MIRRKYNSRKLSHPFVLWKCEINGFFLLHKTIMMDFTKWWSCTKQSMAWLYRVLQISDWGNKPQQSWVCFSSVRFGNRYSLKYLFYQYMNGKKQFIGHCIFAYNNGKTTRLEIQSAISSTCYRKWHI